MKWRPFRLVAMPISNVELPPSSINQPPAGLKQANNHRTVNGRNPAPVHGLFILLFVSIESICRVGKKHRRWLARFLPSTVLPRGLRIQFSASNRTKSIDQFFLIRGLCRESPGSTDACPRMGLANHGS